MAYAREILGLPVPKVIAWSSRAAATPVGSEFILMEQFEGVTLASQVPSLSGRPEVAALINATIKLHYQLLSAPLSQVGSIYFKEDVSKELQDRPFYAKEFEGDPRASERFRIGPIVTRNFWRGQKSRLDVDRGPCELRSSSTWGGIISSPLCYGRARYAIVHDSCREMSANVAQDVCNPSSSWRPTPSVGHRRLSRHALRRSRRLHRAHPAPHS